MTVRVPNKRNSKASDWKGSQPQKSKKMIRREERKATRKD